MAGSPPNFHKMDYRSACIQGVLKPQGQGQGQGQRSRDTRTFLDSWNELLRHWRSGFVKRIEAPHHSDGGAAQRTPLSIAATASAHEAQKQQEKGTYPA